MRPVISKRPRRPCFSDRAIYRAEPAATGSGARGSPAIAGVHGLDRRDLNRLTPAERHMLLTEQADAWMSQPLEYRPGRILSVR